MNTIEKEKIIKEARKLPIKSVIVLVLRLMWFKGYRIDNKNNLDDKVHKDFLKDIIGGPLSFIDGIYLNTTTSKEGGAKHIIDVTIIIKKMSLSEGEIDRYFRPNLKEIEALILEDAVNKRISSLHNDKSFDTQKGREKFGTQEHRKFIEDDIKINITLGTKRNRNLKFQLLSERRLEKIKTSMKQLERLANKKHYSYDEEDWNKIKIPLMNQFLMLLTAFEGKKGILHLEQMISLYKNMELLDQKKLTPKKNERR